MTPRCGVPVSVGNAAARARRGDPRSYVEIELAEAGGPRAQG